MAHKHSCKKYEILTEEYIDGSLTEKQCREFEAHLAECSECRENLKFSLALHGLIRRSAAEMPEGLHEKIMKTIEDQPRPARKKSSAWVRKAAVFAACFMIFFGISLALAVPMLLKDDGSHDTIPNAGTIFSPSTDVNNILTGDGAFPDNTKFDPAQTDVLLSPDIKPNTNNKEENEPDNTPSVEMITNAIQPSTDISLPELAPTETSPSQEPPIVEDDKQPSSSPDFQPAGFDGPGGYEITLALLIVSGMLAFASFIAFLISLSSVRKRTQTEKDEDKE